MKRHILYLTVAAFLMVVAACGVERNGGQEQGASISALTYTADVDIQSRHPYRNFTNQAWEITAPDGALRLTVLFDRFETERGYDFVYLYDSEGNRVHSLSGNHTGESFTVEGSSVRIRFISDYSITDWGFAITSYTYEMRSYDDHRPVCKAIGSRSEGWYWADTDELIKFENCAHLGEPECRAIGSRSEGWYSTGDPALIVFDNCHRYDDHRPICKAIGSRSEGWYWADTGERIKFENCAHLGEPECGAIGSRSEGWYSTGDPALIVWDNCHRTVRISLYDEPCGPSIGYRCYDNLYCQGLPGPGVIGGSGVCKNMGYCETVEDCSAESNEWIHPMCIGHAVCNSETSSCGWVCDPVNTGPWSWTTILMRNVESAHPYANNFDDTWDVSQPGAEKIKVHFDRSETERNYDFIYLSGDREEILHIMHGNYTDHWSPEFNGDTLHINLRTDLSITRWGFRVDMVSFYEQLPEGRCNRDEDCDDTMMCNLPICINPYAPCYGDCVPRERDDHCDDGTVPLCLIIPPTCEDGLILAYQNYCYACVDPGTCLPPGTPGQEGDPCSDAAPCADGLYCKNIIDGAGTCRGELWCTPETMGADCSNVIHIAVPGSWACPDNQCAWITGLDPRSFTNDTPMSIPDYNAAGITSDIHVSDFPACYLNVSVDVAISHSYRGDLIVGLTDPAGNRVVLHNREGWSADDVIIEGLSLTGQLGLDGANGTWTLDAADLASLDTGTLESWTLHFQCR